MGALAIHHLGFAVQDLDVAVETYERLFGAAFEDRAAGEGMEAVTVLVGPDRIELLSSDDAETPIGKFLTKHRVALDRVAHALLDKETLVRQELDGLLVDVEADSRSSETVGTVRSLPLAGEHQEPTT
jgi:catechol 2,3-dioxygenase-like lactoylglutathione lyase family enzyme